VIRRCQPYWAKEQMVKFEVSADRIWDNLTGPRLKAAVYGSARGRGSR
jgi:hypothetical protein